MSYETDDELDQLAGDALRAGLLIVAILLILVVAGACVAWEIVAGRPQ